ncbi:MAG: hypothetical protein WAT84_02115 [Candidatus Moraniibacteriota bacterium]
MLTYTLHFGETVRSQKEAAMDDTIRDKEGYSLALRETYLEMIESSLGTKIFRRVYVQRPGELFDATKDGNFSCAYFVSSIQFHFHLTTTWHVNVGLTVEDMLVSGWYPTDEPQIGGVIVYGFGKICSDDQRHRHLGFYMGGDTEDKVISNHPYLCDPRRHPLHYIDGRDGRSHRPIEAMYFHEKLVIRP